MLREDHQVVVGADGRIDRVEPRDRPADVDLLAPGLIDLQVNGYDDVDVASADIDGWARLSRSLATQGVTGWCPTLITAPLDDHRAAAERVASMPAVDGGAVAHGLHLEGPFLGSAPGAHQAVSDPSDPIDLGWLDSLPDGVALITLGPERPNVADAIARLTDAGTLVALGHTTASLDQVAAAVDAGARLFTHGFNAAGAMHHRQPGAMGAVLTDDRLAVSLIADGVHVHPTMLDLAWRAKPDGRVVLVSDAVGWRTDRMAAAGVEVRDGAPRLPDGTLAGSALTLIEAVRRCVDEVGVSIERALTAATTTPSDLLGLRDRGRVAPGHRADLVALTPALDVAQVWIAGEPVF